MRTRHCLLLAAVYLLITSSIYGWDFAISTSGNTIVVDVGGMDNTTSHQTCAGASADINLPGANCGVPGLSYASIPITCNRVGAHVVFVKVWDSTTGGAYEVRTGSVTVTEPPPATCPAFNLFARNSTVLTHKFGAEDYPTGQSRDAQVEVIFRPIRVDAGTTMYFKVFDADDPSTYRTLAPAVDDNIDSGAGKLATSPSDTGSKDFTLTVNSDAITTLYLNTTGFASGDNYIVKGTADANLLSDPNFSCGPSTGCLATTTITAWKRVYLEKKQMFRSGLFVAAPAAAGSNQVLVQVPAGLSWNNVSRRAGDSIRLLHAPRFDGVGFSAADFHWEDAVITRVDTVGVTNRRLLTLSAPLLFSYSNDTSYSTSLDDGVSDGVGALASGLYERNESYLNNSFAPAYVEFRGVAQGVQEIPYLPTVRRPNYIANKWFQNTTVTSSTYARPGNSNVKHVLAGSGIPDAAGSVRVSQYTFGETGLDIVPAPSVPGWIPSPNYSWTWVGSIERAVTTNGNPYKNLSSWIFNGENLVHELAHTFDVNSIYYYGSDYGHCNKLMAGNASLNCKMRSSSDPLHVPAQSGDGTLGFHYTSEDDSEYMTMRRAMEPLAVPIR